MTRRAMRIKMPRSNVLLILFISILAFSVSSYFRKEKEWMFSLIAATEKQAEYASAANAKNFEKESLCVFIDLSVPVKGYFQNDSKTMQLLKEIWDNSIFYEENIYIDRNHLFGFGNITKELYLNSVNEILNFFVHTSSDIKKAFEYIKEKKGKINCNNFLFITDLVVSQQSGINDVYDYASSIKNFIVENNFGLWIIGVLTKYFGVLKKSGKRYFFSETKDGKGRWVEMKVQFNKPLYFMTISQTEKGRRINSKLEDVMTRLFGKENVKSVEIYPHNIDNDKLKISCKPSVKDFVIASGAGDNKAKDKNFDNLRKLKIICKSRDIVTLNCSIDFSDIYFNISSRIYDLEFKYNRKYFEVSPGNQSDDQSLGKYQLPVNIKLFCNKVEESYKNAKPDFMFINFKNEIDLANTLWLREWSTNDDYKNYDKTLYLHELFNFLAKNNTVQNQCQGRGIEYKIWR
jgi:hypothetical protein